MKIKRSDLGVTSSALTRIVCIELPKKSNYFAQEVLKSERNKKRVSKFGILRLEKFHQEINEKEKRFNDLEKKLLNVKSSKICVSLAHCECRNKIAISFAELKLINCFVKRAKSILRKYTIA